MDFFSYGDVAPKPHVHDFKYPLEDFGLALEKTRITTTSTSRHGKTGVARRVRVESGQTGRGLSQVVSRVELTRIF